VTKITPPPPPAEDLTARLPTLPLTFSIATSTSVSSMRPSLLTSTAEKTPREMKEKKASKMPCC